MLPGGLPAAYKDLQGCGQTGEEWAAQSFCTSREPGSDGLAAKTACPGLAAPDS